MSSIQILADSRSSHFSDFSFLDDEFLRANFRVGFGEFSEGEVARLSTPELVSQKSSAVAELLDP